jgi:hypothetical protein
MALHGTSASILNMLAAGSSKMLVPIYKVAQCHIQEDRNVTIEHL